MPKLRQIGGVAWNRVHFQSCSTPWGNSGLRVRGSELFTRREGERSADERIKLFKASCCQGAAGHNFCSSHPTKQSGAGKENNPYHLGGREERSTAGSSSSRMASGTLLFRRFPDGNTGLRQKNLVGGGKRTGRHALCGGRFSGVAGERDTDRGRNRVWDLKRRVRSSGGGNSQEGTLLRI